MKEEQAQAVGQNALIWLAGRPDLLEAFLGASGAVAGRLRGQAEDPEFLGAVIEFVLGADESVIALAGDEGRRPDVVAAELMRPGRS